MKKRIICCQFGKKFNDWHVENLKYMIDHHSGIEYDDFEELFNHFNASIYPYLSKKEYQTLVEETYFLIQMTKFRTVKNKYLEVYE